ncbi:hypothetical protein LshimejAT787_0905220 [Lyophyllum shimeji]|uniref:Zinc-finger domain-containing protein n=1 Tax=Lyophyllum shimeji TaxID=47721 RepID=A0A9P3UQI9_LYOSH|nr:hypothetical protein LshimejAT787_0905220 [Lyophyllum shimeji]
MVSSSLSNWDGGLSAQNRNQKDMTEQSRSATTGHVGAAKAVNGVKAGREDKDLDASFYVDGHGRADAGNSGVMEESCVVYISKTAEDIPRTLDDELEHGVGLPNGHGHAGEDLTDRDAEGETVDGDHDAMAVDNSDILQAPPSSLSIPRSSRSNPPSGDMNGSPPHTLPPPSSPPLPKSSHPNPNPPPAASPPSPPSSPHSLRSIFTPPPGQTYDSLLLLTSSSSSSKSPAPVRNPASPPMPPPPPPRKRPRCRVFMSHVAVPPLPGHLDPSDYRPISQPRPRPIPPPLPRALHRPEMQPGPRRPSFPAPGVKHKLTAHDHCTPSAARSRSGNGNGNGTGNGVEAHDDLGAALQAALDNNDGALYAHEASVSSRQRPRQPRRVEWSPVPDSEDSEDEEAVRRKKRRREKERERERGREEVEVGGQSAKKAQGRSEGSGLGSRRGACTSVSVSAPVRGSRPSPSESGSGSGSASLSSAPLPLPQARAQPQPHPHPRLEKSPEAEVRARDAYTGHATQFDICLAPEPPHAVVALNTRFLPYRSFRAPYEGAAEGEGEGETQSDGVDADGVIGKNRPPSTAWSLVDVQEEEISLGPNLEVWEYQEEVAVLGSGSSGEEGEEDGDGDEDERGNEDEDEDEDIVFLGMSSTASREQERRVNTAPENAGTAGVPVPARRVRVADPLGVGVGVGTPREPEPERSLPELPRPHQKLLARRPAGLNGYPPVPVPSPVRREKQKHVDSQGKEEERDVARRVSVSEKALGKRRATSPEGGEREREDTRPRPRPRALPHASSSVSPSSSVRSRPVAANAGVRPRPAPHVTSAPRPPYAPIPRPPPGSGSSSQKLPVGVTPVSRAPPGPGHSPSAPLPPVNGSLAKAHGHPEPSPRVPPHLRFKRIAPHTSQQPDGLPTLSSSHVGGQSNVRNLPRPISGANLASFHTHTHMHSNPDPNAVSVSTSIHLPSPIHISLYIPFRTDVLYPPPGPNRYFPPQSTATTWRHAEPPPPSPFFAHADARSSDSPFLADYDAQLESPDKLFNYTSMGPDVGTWGDDSATGVFDDLVLEDDGRHGHGLGEWMGVDDSILAMDHLVPGLVDGTIDPSLLGGGGQVAVEEQKNTSLRPLVDYASDSPSPSPSPSPPPFLNSPLVASSFMDRDQLVSSNPDPQSPASRRSRSRSSSSSSSSSSSRSLSPTRSVRGSRGPGPSRSAASKFSLGGNALSSPSSSFPTQPLAGRRLHQPRRAFIDMVDIDDLNLSSSDDESSLRGGYKRVAKKKRAKRGRLSDSGEEEQPRPKVASKQVDVGGKLGVQPDGGWPKQDEEDYCHQCRNKSLILKLVCPCAKKYCVRCLTLKYTGKLKYDLSLAYFTCPSCKNNCTCDKCCRNRGEEYLPMKQQPPGANGPPRAKKPTDPEPKPSQTSSSSRASASEVARPRLGGKTNLPPPTVSGPVVYFGATYSLTGEMIGKAFVGQGGGGGEEVVVVRPLGEAAPAAAKRERTFVGDVQEAWGLGDRYLVKELDPVSWRDKNNGPNERMYVGEKKPLYEPASRMPWPPPSSHVVAAAGDDHDHFAYDGGDGFSSPLSPLSSLEDEDESDEAPGEGESRSGFEPSVTEADFEMVAQEGIDSFLAKGPGKAFSADRLAETDVARAISLGLLACGVAIAVTAGSHESQRCPHQLDQERPENRAVAHFGSAETGDSPLPLPSTSIPIRIMGSNTQESAPFAHRRRESHQGAVLKGFELLALAVMFEQAHSPSADCEADVERDARPAALPPPDKRLFCMAAGILIFAWAEHSLEVANVLIAPHHEGEDHRFIEQEARGLVGLLVSYASVCIDFSLTSFNAGVDVRAPNIPKFPGSCIAFLNAPRDGFYLLNDVAH